MLSQGEFCVAVGGGAGATGQGLATDPEEPAGRAVAVGIDAGADQQRYGAVAIGSGAGNITQGIQGVACGFNAGAIGQGDYAVAVGSGAAGNREGEVPGQGTRAVAVGFNAGKTSQGVDAVAVGALAGLSNQGDATVAVGLGCGNISQRLACVAIGNNAGSVNQGQPPLGGQPGNAIAIGSNAGNQGQRNSAIAIGNSAGAGLFETPQDSFAIAIGASAGEVGQGNSAIAIGTSAGQGSLNVAACRQGFYGIAIGVEAGAAGQGATAIAIGTQAGRGIETISEDPRIDVLAPQGGAAIAIGSNAGDMYQGANSIAIGEAAGRKYLGEHAIAIGTRAAATLSSNVGDNYIVFNATGTALNPAGSSRFYVKPVRALSTPLSEPSNDFTPLMYSATSGEIVRNAVAPAFISYTATIPTPLASNLVTYTEISGFQTAIESPAALGSNRYKITLTVRTTGVLALADAQSLFVSFSVTDASPSILQVAMDDNALVLITPPSPNAMTVQSSIVTYATFSDPFRLPLTFQVCARSYPFDETNPQQLRVLSGQMLIS
jgi:hypothetical protein